MKSPNDIFTPLFLLFGILCLRRSFVTFHFEASICLMSTLPQGLQKAVTKATLGSVLWTNHSTLDFYLTPKHTEYLLLVGCR